MVRLHSFKYIMSDTSLFPPRFAAVSCYIPPQRNDTALTPSRRVARRYACFERLTRLTRLNFRLALSLYRAMFCCFVVLQGARRQLDKAATRRRHGAAVDVEEVR